MAAILEQIRSFLDALPKYRGVNANEQMLVTACAAEGKPVSEVFGRIKYQLAVNGDYAEAYRTFFQKHPEYSLQANVAILDEALLAQGAKELGR